MMKNELKRYLGNKKTTTTTQRINDDLKRKKKEQVEMDHSITDM